MNQKRGTYLFGIIAVVAVMVFVVMYFAFNSFLKKETYYVLNQDVTPKTVITEDMLDPISTSEGTAPPNAISLADVQNSTILTKYQLYAGDILTASAIGGVQDLTNGIPDNWVVTSITVPADDALSGLVKRGTYFDIMAIGTDAEGRKAARYVFLNVLALDATVGAGSLNNADSINSSESYDGQTEQYFLGMRPEDAAKLHALKENGDKLKLVLSPNQNRYKKPDVLQYEGVFTSPDAPIWAGASEGGEITDNNFPKLERDPSGKPLKQPAYCTHNNEKISGENCQNVGKSKEQTTSPEKDTPAPQSGSAESTQSLGDAVPVPGS